MKRRFIFTFTSVALSVILAASLAACNKKETSEKEYKVTYHEAEGGINYDNEIAYLVKDRTSDYNIIYPENCGAAVKQGATEIRDLIAEATHTYVKLLDDSGLDYNSDSKIISVGKTRALKASGLNFDYSKLKQDGFFIKSDNDSLFIDGITDRGTLYGAYDFVEKFLGVKYLTPTYNYVPELTEIPLYETDITDNPAINDRCYASSYSFNSPQYMSRLRMVSEFSTISDTYGGSIGWFNDTKELGNYVHNTLYYVNPDDYLATHPEWFFIENGAATDLHYSNLGLNEDGSIDESLSESPVKIVIEKLKRFITNSNDNVKYFMIGQMDIKWTCNCKDCLAQEKKYGRSGMNIRFVNAVAREIKKWQEENGITRDIYVCTFAYQWSQSAPVKKVNGEYVVNDPTVIPDDNVLIRIAPIQADNYYGMIDENQNEKTRELMLGWKFLLNGGPSMVWSYHSRFTFFMCYYPTMHHWQEDLKLYEDMNVQYLYMHGFHADKNDWKVEMEAYVGSKMMWNPNLDAETLRNEFIEYYYRDISDLVKDYVLNYDLKFKEIEEREDSPDMTLQGGDEILSSKYYSVAFFEHQLGLIDEMYAKAEALNVSVAEKKQYKVMIDRLKLTSQFMLLYHYDEYFTDDYWGKKAMLDDFFATCTSLEIRNWREFNGSLSTLKTSFGYTD